MIRGEVNAAQLKQLRQALKQADMSPAKRQRLLWRIARRGLIPLAKRHVRAQTAPDGSPWPKRRRGKRKMLTGLPKFLGVRENGDGSVTLRFGRGSYESNTHAGAIGYVNQHGADIQMSAAALRRSGTQQAGKSATRAQARTLVSLGYQVPDTPDRGADGRYKAPTTRGKKRRVSQAWICANLSMAQAGLIIRQLKGEAPKTAWTITLPARAFLGASDDEFATILARELRGIQFGWNVKKQDIKR
ncbi:hypothetical protein DBV23_15905 [Edwardsiella ictaluri]|uniref:Phage virion morphogenesis protein n=1 Tax=Edwardsiella ictaluri (strain 93-146) TaxID=634503 RepID=C5BH04_EDWI9|nr:hypothetical protein [Edwardsiella ictaluri]ACR69435.1 hypothetical protein NT01EI_2261 [Edwardsiella ictaluri 93-146]AVZ83549.1 hypothetical protein DBV23_15905 [Edwardsiella ictaluri]EKS7764159.1 hypothetical protein [Edwardsiella ictaluri]EKS7771018.1 hypothetical protein [Edwardsiella ictaluri]EKS7774110.1 hypothetical protein [Edwardsiella ictaluri]